MIDVANVRDIWAKVGDHLPDFAARLGGVDCVKRQSRLGYDRPMRLEICVRHKVVIVISSLAARIGHRKQSYLMTPPPHQFHGFEQVSFGPAKPEVVLVAVENPHRSTFRTLWAAVHVLRVRENRQSARRGFGMRRTLAQCAAALRDEDSSM